MKIQLYLASTALTAFMMFAACSKDDENPPTPETKEFQVVLRATVTNGTVTDTSKVTYTDSSGNTVVDSFKSSGWTKSFKAKAGFDMLLGVKGNASSNSTVQVQALAINGTDTAYNLSDSDTRNFSFNFDLKVQRKLE